MLTFVLVFIQVGPVYSWRDEPGLAFFGELWCSGKSWFAGRYIREWKKQHPDGKVTVFSQVPDDKELDKCGITKIAIDDGLVDNPPELKDYANCLVVFDDIDAIRDKKIKKIVTDLCDELQVVGRHDNTWVIRTSHLFRNWGTTRASLAEANKTVFFPQLGSSYGIRNWLKTHIGLDPKKIERMFKIRSRWVVLDQHVCIRCLSCFISDIGTKLGIERTFVVHSMNLRRRPKIKEFEFSKHADALRFIELCIKAKFECAMYGLCL